MRICHLADLHFHREHYEEARASIQTVIDEHAREPFDLIAAAGDTWDGPITNSAGSRFGDFLELVRDLAECAPVAMIYGTPSHDTEGSLEVFEAIKARHPITILQPGRAYFYDERRISESPSSTAEALLFGVPEPNKKWLLASAGATGKDTSDAFVRDAVSALFLGLGGMRKQHAELPCILLYHGQVVGAKSATGFGATAGAGLAITRDDLAQVGADYIALGDIHEPQRIGDLPAYYSGSIYPGNWGETHKAGANVVELRALGVDQLGSGVVLVDVSRLNFPHPQRIKLARRWPAALSLESPTSLVGMLAWQEITCTREEADQVDLVGQEEALLRMGALPGSRVSLNILPTETVRAGEITEKKTLADKVMTWGDNSSIEIPISVLEKANELEREAQASGATGKGASIRIDRLILRGAKGLWKKSRKDEIDLNLEALGSGVLALIGANGEGKTTILENLHPWPCMLTRDGTLKDHFRLKDSFRDLYFTDESTGIRYRAFIQIRADIASGSAEYFLYRDSGKGFEPMSGINGRKEPYEQAVSELFGSLEMYLRTAFVTQRPTKLAPDLGAATQGQRKALFGELAGIDYLERYREAAKARGDALEGELSRLDATIAAAQDVDALIATLEADIKDSEERRRAAEADAQFATDRGMVLKEEREAIASRVSILEGKATRRQELEREIQELLRSVETAEKEAEGFRVAAEGRGKAEAELASIRELEGEAAALRGNKAVVDEANRKALVAHQEAMRKVDFDRRELQAQLDARCRDLTTEERKLSTLDARFGAPIADHCPTCAQLLPDDKRAHLAEERRTIAAQRSEVDGTRILIAAEVDVIERALSAMTAPVAPTLRDFEGAARLHEIERSLEWTDKAASERILRQADEATVRIEAATTRAGDARGQAARKRLEAQGFDGELTVLPDERSRLSAKDSQLDAERERLTGARSAAAASQAFADAARRNLEAAQVRKTARDNAKTTRDETALELADWRLLERACGPNGIQALELDALAPSIADVSNRILSGAYGSRYQIEFRTQREAGKGSKAKLVEDFEIMILDTESGEEQTIDSLSGGESVWIRKSLYDGFGIIRAKNTGTRFQTVFLDEADGALDPEARMLYLRMLEAAHREAGRFQTILITHSTELQEMVERVVKVAELKARVEKAEGEIKVLREGIALAKGHLILAWKRAGDLDGARAKISHAQLVLDSAMIGKPAEEALAGKE